MKRKYPYTAWALTPSYNVVQVELVKQTWEYYASWDSTAAGKSYSTSDLHPDRDTAIKAGRIAVSAAEVKLAKSRVNLDKKIANLKKAEAAK